MGKFNSLAKKGMSDSIALKQYPARFWVYLIVLIVLICFQTIMKNSFTWDDTHNFVENPHFRGLGLSHLSWMFKTFHDANYHPLVWMSFGADYVLWGMDPAGYHLTNLIWHIFNSMTFFYLMARFINIANPVPAALGSTVTSIGAVTGTLFFALHPLRVESVAWISARADLICAAFYMLTVMAYLNYIKTEDHKRRWYVSALFFFLFSLLSRAWGITLPVILLILDHYPLRRLHFKNGFDRFNIQVVLEKIPFIILAADSAYLAFLAKSRNAVMLNLDQHGLLERLVQSAYGLIFYLWKTLVPIQLSPLYLLDRNFDPFEAKYIAAASILILISMALFMIRKRLPGPAIAFLCYAVIVTPVLGIVQVGPQIAADRYTYISCMPFAVLVGIGLHHLLSKTNSKTARHMIAAVVILILSTFFILSCRQTRIWQSENTLWTRAIQVEPKNYAAYWNRGLLMDGRQNFERALSDYSNAIKYNPTDDKYYNNRGAIRKYKGNLIEAMEDFNAAIKLNPKSPEPYANRAAIYASQNHTEQAIRDYQKALEVAPQNWEQRKTVEMLLNKISINKKSRDSGLKNL
jgi:protein O-mannosyl-transferase